MYRSRTKGNSITMDTKCQSIAEYLLHLRSSTTARDLTPKYLPRYLPIPRYLTNNVGTACHHFSFLHHQLRTIPPELIESLPFLRDATSLRYQILKFYQSEAESVGSVKLCTDHQTVLISPWKCRFVYSYAYGEI